MKRRECFFGLRDIFALDRLEQEAVDACYVLHFLLGETFLVRKCSVGTFFNFLEVERERRRSVGSLLGVGRCQAEQVAEVVGHKAFKDAMHRVHYQFPGRVPVRKTPKL